MSFQSIRIQEFLSSCLRLERLTNQYLEINRAFTIDNFEKIPKEHEEIAEERAPLLPRNRDEVTKDNKIGRTSLQGSGFNLTCTIVDSGIMSLPANLENFGVVAGVVLILHAALLTVNSAKHLGLSILHFLFSTYYMHN